MSGILFFKSKNRDRMKEFYQSQVGMDIWLEQADCVILKHGNLLLGFCDREEVDACGMITFFYPSKAEVDAVYEKCRGAAREKPKENEKYRIYHCFAEDPEGRVIEFQTFLHPVDSHLTGDELLISRRSVRQFEERELPEEILRKLFELCRYAPTSRNSESYYFIAVHDREKIEYLASLREKSSAPIARAPVAIVICSDPGLSKRHIQDGCIAAYHFTLAAWSFGLGTCWIGGMDTEEVKQCLDIPKDHYVATVTPLGYPAEQPNMRPRKPREQYVTVVK
jgi:nitroreductase